MADPDAGSLTPSAPSSRTPWADALWCLGDEARLLVSAAGRLLDANPAARRRLGLPAELGDLGLDDLLPSLAAADFLAGGNVTPVHGKVTDLAYGSHAITARLWLYWAPDRQTTLLVLHDISRCHNLESRLAELVDGHERQVESRTFELQVLLDLAEEVGYTLSQADVFQCVFAHLQRVVDHDVGAVIVTAGADTTLTFHGPRPVAPAVADDLAATLTATLAGLGGRDVGVPVVSHAAGSGAVVAKVGSRFFVPLVLAPGETSGLLLVASEAEDAFTENEARFLHALAGYASLCVQRLRAAVAAEHGRLAEVLADLPDGVVLLGRDQRILLANARAKDYLEQLGPAGPGDRLDTLGGRPVGELFVPPPADQLYHRVAVAEPEEQLFTIIVRDFGDLDAVAGHQHLLVIRDSTAENRLQMQVSARDRLAAVGQVAAGIAHDFNNALTSIIGFGSLIHENEEVPQHVRDAGGIIAEQGRRSAQLIRQILDFSRHSMPEIVELDLAAFLPEVVKLVRRTIVERIDVDCQTDGGGYLVAADPAQLEHILLNLCLNARDAMPEGGRIELSLRRVDGPAPVRLPPDFGDLPAAWAVIRVSDTGTGMTSAVLAHIFEPFYTTKSRGKGSGLGLAQAHGLVRQHGGVIDVASTVGRGTTFTICLPIVAHVPVVEAPPAPRPAVAAPVHGTVLIAEDEETVRSILGEIVRSLGLEPLLAINGSDAFELWEENRERIRLVVSDLVMPEMGGDELYAKLQEAGADVRVIFVSGYAMERQQKELLSRPEIAFVHKPFEPDVLADLIVQQLNSGSPVEGKTATR